MSTYKVAFIGTGGRSCSYSKVYQPREDIDIVALADPNPGHRRVMIERTGLTGGFAEYDDWHDLMAAHDDLDGVVITSPNHTHADPAIACFERGLPIALEKPLAANAADCDRIVDAARAHSGRSLLGFVLRSTPFYSTIWKLIRDGAIGRLVSLQADELVGWAVSSIMKRSPWRRYTALSGGSMIEKCCHDLDILNWMMGCRAVSLNSYGGRLLYNPNPSLPATCDGCGVADTCKYYKEPPKAAHEDEAEQRYHDFARSEEARCIYNIDSDVSDVQSVSLEYENGAVANFLLNFHCAGPRASRNFHAAGTGGRVWGNLHEAMVYRYDNRSGETTEIDCRGDGSGHGGGDRLHALLLQKMMAEPEFRPEQDAMAGYVSAIMSFATDVSRLERRRVELRYHDDGKMDIV